MEINKFLYIVYSRPLRPDTFIKESNISPLRGYVELRWCLL